MNSLNSNPELKKANEQLQSILFNTDGKPANQNNIILVANPDVQCDDEDSIEGWSHRDYFEVKWDSRPHRIAPGMTRNMPLWLASHFAKYMADHLLMKEEVTTNKKNLVQSPVRRPIILSTILLKTVEYFDEPEFKREGDVVEEQVESLNIPNEFSNGFGGGKATELPEQNIGSIPNVAVGVLRGSTSVEPELPKSTENKTSIYDETKPRPTKKELIAEADKLDIELSGNETVDQLISKIKAF